MLHHVVSNEYNLAIKGLGVFDAVHANAQFLRDAYHCINPDSTLTINPYNDALQVLKFQG